MEISWILNSLFGPLSENVVVCMYSPCIDILMERLLVHRNAQKCPRLTQQRKARIEELRERKLCHSQPEVSYAEVCLHFVCFLSETHFIVHNRPFHMDDGQVLERKNTSTWKASSPILGEQVHEKSLTALTVERSGEIVCERATNFVSASAYPVLPPSAQMTAIYLLHPPDGTFHQT